MNEINAQHVTGLVHEPRWQTALLDALPANIALLDAGGVILAVNKAWRRFAHDNGLRHAEHGVGLNYLDVCDQASGADAALAESVAAGLRAVLAGERSDYSLEYPCDSPTEERRFLLSATALERGRRGAAVVMHVNVSERARAEQATRKLAARLSNTLESITDAFFTVDREWHFTYINRQAERLLRQTRDTMLGCSLWDIYPDALGTIFERSYRRAMAGASGVSFEAFYPPLLMWFGIDCHPSDDGLSVYFRDVTAARAARQQLKLLEASVAQLNDMVVIMEPAPALPQGLRIVFVNEAFVRTTGYTRAQAIGQPPGLLNGPQTDAAELERIRVASEHSEPVHAELLAYMKDGRRRWFEVDITPVAAFGERHTHFVVIQRDITERRRSEEALRALNAGLEERVRHRTLELEHARALAEQANRAKSSFLATMSHETRTPMNGVIGMIDVLAESELGSDQRDMVKIVRESAYALLAIVDNVLDFSKIEAGQFEVEHAPMDVEKVVESVCDTLRGLAESRGVSLRSFTDPRLPARMLGDAGRLRQVLLNLVGNAIKFSSAQTHPGSVSLRALRVVDAAGKDSLSLAISDNGLGMDEATQARLFSPFMQADASTTRRFGGTGLGLSISQRLVALMSGEITVSSAVGQGTTFTVRLPIVFPAAGDTSIEAPARLALAGLPCLLLGAAGQAADLAQYLIHADCTVMHVQTLAAAQAWLHEVEPGCCVIVVLDPPEGIGPALAACRAVAMERPEIAPGFVVIEAGRRLRPRRQKPDQVGLDGECLHRAVFLHGVALAAGLEPVGEDADAQAGGGMNALAQVQRSDTDPLILVAEDNEINQKVLVKQLELLGYRAEIVGNGLEALAQWRRGGYALLLTDLHMPVMDGYTLAAAVRTEERGGSRLPIIALTANALRDEEVRCRQAGMDGYMSKPVRLAQLKTALDAWLRPALPPASETTPDAPASIPPPLVDLSVLAELIGDDEAVMREVLETFRTNTLQSALELKRAHADGALQSMADITHKLKSAARSIGAARLGQICAEIEEAATHSPRGAALPPLMAAFESELRAVHQFLDER